MTSKLLSLLTVSAALAFATAPARAANASTSIGGGVQYNHYLDDVDTDHIDENAFSYVIALRNNTSYLLGFEIDLELQPEELTGRDEMTYVPQAYLFLGKVIYAGAGVGISYFDGDFADEPNYYLRAGLDLEALPGLFLDISARYIIQDIENISDEVTESIDGDSITLGANLRFRI
ncbi:MAG: outer membrane beta-barrel protein [bacterium]